MSGPAVDVLMSTFDGVRWLAPQLASLFGQTLAPRRIWVRDDGSRDGTADLVAATAGPAPITLIRGANLGAARSFLALLDEAGADADYVAFADQDDVWAPDKLARAVAALAAGDPTVPRLYCGRLEYVDEDLRHLGHTRAHVAPSYANALVENVAAGCTVVINRAARDLLAGRRPAALLWHDWWMYLVVAAFGEVIHDPVPAIRYRQHGANVIGRRPGALGTLARRLGAAGRGKPAVSVRDQAAAFLACYGEALPPDRRALAERLARPDAGFAHRLGLAFGSPLRRQAPLDDLALKGLLLLGWY